MPDWVFLKFLLSVLLLGGIANSQSGPCDRSRKILSDVRGVISTGPIGANYTQDSHCEWLIKSLNNSERFISLTFRSMGTECAYDYVFVYDGASFESPLLGSFSGRTAPPTVTATSGKMLLLLYSDTNYVLDGFRAEYTITACPSNCSDRGYCLKGRCICNDAEWGGLDCSRELCPNACGKQERHGQCDEGHCICRSNYAGRACSLPEKDPAVSRWHYLSQTGEGLTPRAAHSAVYVTLTDSLYVFGGYNLNDVLGDLEVYNFQRSSWRNAQGKDIIDWESIDQVDPSDAADFIAEQSFERLGLPRRSLVSNIFYALGDNSTKIMRKQRRHSGGLWDEYSDGPEPRYGHSSCAIKNGFILYGGESHDNSLMDDLWYYDVQTRKWQLLAEFSEIKPPKLTRHTLTCINETIYLFGGSMQDGKFSSQLWRIQLNYENGTEEWEEVKARGGKQLDVRVVAHTTVYYKVTNSLIIYGGIVAGVARFSKLSDKMFAFQLDHKHWTEIHYKREHLREQFVPRERAFHSANIFGNYLVIFGGYSHRHNKEEICYDNQMYLYHLGCHTWVNPDILDASHEFSYPKQQGVFAHASSIRSGHTLILVGGYHGNVNGDLLAWTVPLALRDISPTAACTQHRSFGACSADPECGWCSADDRCYGRTVGANCTTNLQTARCPGICPALQDCHSCLMHGNEEDSATSVAYRLGLGECTWCVQNARCHPIDDPHGGACGAQEDSPSQTPGWWGSKGKEIRQPQNCAAMDQRPGLTFIKYNHPVNLSQPDHVAILNATVLDYNSGALTLSPRYLEGINGEMLASLRGFLHLPPDWHETLKVCVSYSKATLSLAEIIILNSTAEQKNCNAVPWPEDLDNEKIPIEFQSIKSLGALYNAHHQSRMELQHFKPDETPKVFTFEYLEPFSNGTCTHYTNCLHCLTDSECGWCELTNTCQLRIDNEQDSCTLDGDWRYLTLLPGMCPNCTNFISCTSCIETNLCEWWVEEARCARIGQRKSGSIVSVNECPIPCYLRKACESCLDHRGGRCVWCQATQKCFSFSVYTSEYQFGLCREWLDQALPLSSIANQDNSSSIPAKTSQEQCKSCASHTNCSSCLSALSCGWCHDASNPMSGQCVKGDFLRPVMDCSDVIGGREETRWAYAQCPDVDECGLGLHDCHPQAECINTDGSFSCHCRKGFIGDGRSSCVRTCYNVCVHGNCQGDPDYKCICDVGWYGDDCSKNCGCNNHSACPQGYQICEKCEDNTLGTFCEYCRLGSYGNATTEQGCQKCDCNGHGDMDRGECDVETGECFCQDNTEGMHCEKCRPNYSGDPRNGKQCYYQCEARGFLTDPKGQGISSLQNYSPPFRSNSPPIRECLWIIKPDVDYGVPIIQLQLNASQLNVTCGENAVYVYDGLPELVEDMGQSALTAVFCSEEAHPTTVVESRTGHLTVHYKQGLPYESFSAIYRVFSCNDCQYPRVCNKEGKCVCSEGFVGMFCEHEICPRNCSADFGRGYCDRNYGRCLCNEGWTDVDCNLKETKLNLIFMELFNTEHLSSGLDHLRKTLPRFGHSLVSDRRGSLWMFGGYSLSHGPLNDIRLFDTKNMSWIQVTVESTPDAKMPQGRYFHGADIVLSKQAIFVFGGLTKPQKNVLNRTLHDFWQFDIPNQRWNEIKAPLPTNTTTSSTIYWSSKKWPHPVYGHTLTYYRNIDREESLILVGGHSANYGFTNLVWEYSIEKNLWTSIPTKGIGPSAIFGHSTVFHALTNSLYVFGGYVYDKQKSILSNTLYRLDFESKTWIQLSGSTSSNEPKPRFFHSAVSTDNYMLLLGGRIHPWNISDTLYVFSYNCNQWINLMTPAIQKIGPYPKQTYGQAMTVEPDGDAAYVIGGWDVDTYISVLKIELPIDICNLFLTKSSCLKIPGCAYCANKNGDDIVSQICHRNTLDCPLRSTGSEDVVLSNNGLVCDGTAIIQYPIDNCSLITNCAICNLTPNCIFCNTTNICINGNLENKCATQNCPYNRCKATDCIQCYHQEPSCHWNYSRRKCEILQPTQDLSTEVSQCPTPCITHLTCRSCLHAPGCHWSTRLRECITMASQSVYCAGGTCGLVLEASDAAHCPEPCNVFGQCSTCLRHGPCGWCAEPGVTGKGLCAEGNSERPMKGSCNRILEESMNLLDGEIKDPNITYSWHYVMCPKENECLNHHHQCLEESEICVDLDNGYMCQCGNGYKEGPAGCEPICPQGCVRGRCIAPSQCECEFGYVGANCSIQCLCHGHSNCEGPDKLDICIDCHNNTMGKRCEHCKPLFVGDPTNRTACIPCLEYCHGHSAFCVDPVDAKQPNDYIDEETVLFTSLKFGPKSIATCLRCGNKTTGDRCDECVPGNFRGSDELQDPCRPCDCHGHGSKCHPVTGDQCDCQNNTMSDECAGQGRNSAQPCWQVQCSKCREGFLGTPTKGRQCYRQMSVESIMCFDAKPIDECKIPKPLLAGELVFFVIQPRFMNVDIRIVVDVTQGALDVFMSTHDDTYIVFPNHTSGINFVDLDESYKPFGNASRLSEDDTYFKTEAVGLRTYITVTKPKTILTVTNLTARLVITLPEEYHKLENTRFFLILQSIDERQPAYGVVFSRQDQLHIDLFVFFSVFFSVFFLFLAACVVAWKAKQAAHARHARRRHVVEMLHMAQRPFASVMVDLAAKIVPNSKRNAHHNIRPVAIEPTGDGMAAVATIFVSLPGSQNLPVKLALASSLILLARQLPTSNRIFLRRRSTHVAPPT